MINVEDINQNDATLRLAKASCNKEQEFIMMYHLVGSLLCHIDRVTFGKACLDSVDYALKIRPSNQIEVVGEAI